MFSLCSEFRNAQVHDEIESRRKRLAMLSITHKLGARWESKLDIGEA
jgi:hypothetical protein